MVTKEQVEEILSQEEPSIYDEYDRDKEIKKLNGRIKVLGKYLKRIFLTMPKSNELCPQCHNQSLEPILKQCNNQDCKYQTKRRLKYKSYTIWEDGINEEWLYEEVMYK